MRLNQPASGPRSRHGTLTLNEGQKRVSVGDGIMREFAVTIRQERPNWMFPSYPEAG